MMLGKLIDHLEKNTIWVQCKNTVLHCHQDTIQMDQKVIKQWNSRSLRNKHGVYIYLFIYFSSQCGEVISKCNIKPHI